MLRKNTNVWQAGTGSCWQSYILLLYHSLSYSLRFRLKVQPATQRRAALFGVNIWPLPDKTTTPSTDTVPPNGSRSCFDGVSTLQRKWAFSFPWVLRSQNKFLIWIPVWNSASNLQMRARVQVPLVSFSCAHPFVCFATFQMNSKYPLKRAMDSWQLWATPIEKALWNNSRAVRQQLQPTFEPIHESPIWATGVCCSVEVKLSPLIPLLLFDNPFTACFAAFFAVILLPE